ncbi:luciferase family protein [Streptomyces sp. NPDC060064]|uniref:luciferase domain-containing protein n=1 Tax=Streptomyces sp. NPDC060064 TaxID=3347049 RepID=UPI003681C8E8
MVGAHDHAVIREGDRPETGPEVPHLQYTQISPPQIKEALRHWMATALPGIVPGHSEISVPSTWAVFLSDVAPAEGARLFLPRGNAEFAHLHADGSLHLALDPADHPAFLASGWGEKHPLYDRGVNVVMFYAPRDQAELEVAKKVIAASYQYATGHAHGLGVVGTSRATSSRGCRCASRSQSATYARLIVASKAPPPRPSRRRTGTHLRPRPRDDHPGRLTTAARPALIDARHVKWHLPDRQAGSPC